MDGRKCCLPSKWRSGLASLGVRNRPHWVAVGRYCLFPPTCVLLQLFRLAGREWVEKRRENKKGRNKMSNCVSVSADVNDTNVPVNDKLKVSVSET